VRVLSPVIARVNAALTGSTNLSWEELSVTIAAQSVLLDGGRASASAPVSAAAISRVTRTVRTIERRSQHEVRLADLAREAKLSPFHFLRTFEALTGVTPHQYLLRLRLRRAATRLLLEPTTILDIALDSGFGDVSNFHRAFRAEFGVSLRTYRRNSQR
jgi:AraC family transcriptional regulator